MRSKFIFFAGAGIAVVFIYTCAIIYLESLVFHFVQVQCDWPELNPLDEDPTVDKSDEEPVRALILTDMHLLGSTVAYWIDKIHKDWQMHHAFQTAVALHQPDLVFILGDLTDEGHYSESDNLFKETASRFFKLFAIPKNTTMYIIPGNHDIGFHYRVTANRVKRFYTFFHTDSAQLISIRGNHFVLINSIGLENDGCYLCNDTKQQLTIVEKKLKCMQGKIDCDTKGELRKYSKPILMQHYPLYRVSDEDCKESDSAPFPQKTQAFKEPWDCLNKNATAKLLNQIKPRLVLCGHTHNGCSKKLPYGEGLEITLSSFSWRNKNNPCYGLLVATPNNYAFTKCYMPTQSSAITRNVLAGIICFLGLYYWGRRLNRRSIGYI